MGYRGLVGQSAIEYLMTYGWMLLVVSVVGGAIFATVGDQNVESTSGFDGDVRVDNFGVSDQEELGLEVRDGSGQGIKVSKVNVSDPDTGQWVYKEFTGDRKVDVGSSKIFELPNVSRSDGSNSLDVEIIYDSGGLSNLSVRGTVSGSIELTASGSYEGDPENDHQSIDTGGLSLLTTETYTYTGSKETVDLDNDFSKPVEEITIVEMHGANGSSAVAKGGSGGFIANATADVSSYNTLEIWVGETTGNNTGGWGRSAGGKSADGTSSECSGDEGGGGGGSTEIVAGSDLVAAADAGGGAGELCDGTGGVAGGGGARGGSGGTAVYIQGEDAEGTGNGGEGGADASDGSDGGQELGIASLDSDGQTNTGGSDNGSGEITIEYYG